MNRFAPLLLALLTALPAISGASGINEDMKKKLAVLALFDFSSDRCDSHFVVSLNKVGPLRDRIDTDPSIREHYQSQLSYYQRKFDEGVLTCQALEAVAEKWKQRMLSES